MDTKTQDRSTVGRRPASRDRAGVTDRAARRGRRVEASCDGPSLDREREKPPEPEEGRPDPPVDLREALFNDGATGPASRIQVPMERITRLRGLMIDLDPGKLLPDNGVFPPAEDPREFLRGIQAVLDRHPLARDAEVRATGTGLHVLVWFEPAVELKDAADQRRWDSLIKLTQATVPSDPQAPGITALTRAVGSVNAKNGARVEILRPGTPIDPQRVVEFAESVRAAPFRTVAGILLGSQRVTPCPFCLGPRSTFAVLDHAGTCYSCGKLGLAALYDAILSPEPPAEAAGTAEVGRSRKPSKQGPKAAQRSPRRG